MMKNAVWLISYKLVQGVSTDEFLKAAQPVHDEVLSQKEGFVSWQVLTEGDTFIDHIVWASEEDAQNASKEEDCASSATEAYYAMIDFSTLQHQMCTVTKSF